MNSKGQLPMFSPIYTTLFVVVAIIVYSEIYFIFGFGIIFFISFVPAIVAFCYVDKYEDRKLEEGMKDWKERIQKQKGYCVYP